jgi:hypothetical protein
VATTPVRRFRVSDAEWEAWRETSGGNVSRWLRDLANSAAVSEREGIGNDVPRAARGADSGSSRSETADRHFKPDFKD